MEQDRKTSLFKGCLLSPLIFSLCMEPLANIIRAHEHIQGMTFGNKEVRLDLLANDVVVYLTSPTQSIHHLESVLLAFSKILGLTLNNTKSELYPIYLSEKDRDALKSITSFWWITPEDTWKSSFCSIGEIYTRKISRDYIEMLKNS